MNKKGMRISQGTRDICLVVLRERYQVVALPSLQQRLAVAIDELQRGDAVSLVGLKGKAPPLVLCNHGVPTTVRKCDECEKDITRVVKRIIAAQKITMDDVAEFNVIGKGKKRG